MLTSFTYLGRILDEKGICGMWEIIELGGLEISWWVSREEVRNARSYTLCLQ